jgi:hypothetical protein
MKTKLVAFTELHRTGSWTGFKDNDRYAITIDGVRHVLGYNTTCSSCCPSHTLLTGALGITELSNNPDGISHGAWYRSVADPKERWEKVGTLFGTAYRVHDGYPADERNLSITTLRAEEAKEDVVNCCKADGLEPMQRKSLQEAHLYERLARIKAQKTVVQETQHSCLPDVCFAFTQGISPERLSGLSQDNAKAEMYPAPNHTLTLTPFLKAQVRRESLVQCYYHTVKRIGKGVWEVEFSPYLWEGNVINAERRLEKGLPLIGGSPIWAERWKSGDDVKRGKERLGKLYKKALSSLWKPSSAAAFHLGDTQKKSLHFDVRSSDSISTVLGQSDVSEWVRLNREQRMLRPSYSNLMFGLPQYNQLAPQTERCTGSAQPVDVNVNRINTVPTRFVGIGGPPSICMAGAQRIKFGYEEKAEPLLGDYKRQAGRLFSLYGRTRNVHVERILTEAEEKLFPAMPTKVTAVGTSKTKTAAPKDFPWQGTGVPSWGVGMSATTRLANWFENRLPKWTGNNQLDPLRSFTDANVLAKGDYFGYVETRTDGTKTKWVIENHKHDRSKKGEGYITIARMHKEGATRETISRFMMGFPMELIDAAIQRIALEKLKEDNTFVTSFFQTSRNCKTDRTALYRAAFVPLTVAEFNERFDNPKRTVIPLGNYAGEALLHAASTKHVCTRRGTQEKAKSTKPLRPFHVLRPSEVHAVKIGKAWEKLRAKKGEVTFESLPFSAVGKTVGHIKMWKSKRHGMAYLMIPIWGATLVERECIYRPCSRKEGVHQTTVVVPSDEFFRLTDCSTGEWKVSAWSVDSVEAYTPTASGTNGCSADMLRFYSKFTGRENLVNAPMPTLNSKTEKTDWVVRLKHGGQFTVSEGCLIRDEQHKEKGIIVGTLSWKAALTHCNIVYGITRTQANEAKENLSAAKAAVDTFIPCPDKAQDANLQRLSMDWEAKNTLACDWYAKAAVCKVAGGTQAKDFEIEPTKSGDAWGRSKARYTEHLAIPDPKETGDDEFDIYEETRKESDSEYGVDAEQELPVDELTKEDLEEGFTALDTEDAPDAGEELLESTEEEAEEDAE